MTAPYNASLLGLMLKIPTGFKQRQPSPQQVPRFLKLSFLGGDTKEKMIAHIGCELHEIEKGAFEYWCNALDSKVAKKEA